MQDLLKFKGKTCVVTGAASGIGEAAAKLLIDQGAEVYALDVKEPAFPVKRYVNVNLGDKQSIDDAVKQLPISIDKVFNCAGVAGPIYGGRTFTTLEVITINFLGPRYLIESLIPRMSEGDSIAAIASTAGMTWMNRIDDILPFVEISDFKEAQDWFTQHETEMLEGYESGIPSYFFSKEALIIWVKNRAYSLSEKKIRLNTLSPSSTATPMSKDFSANSKGLTGSFISKVGVQATAEDQAKALLFLNSDLASYVSGHDLQADYGFTATKLYGLGLEKQIL